MFNFYPFTKQHRPVRSFTDHRAKSKLRFHLSPDGVRHAVRPQGPHHAQSLQWGFVLPFLWEFLFFRTLWLHKLLPAFGRALNVSVQVPELFHGAQGLVDGGEKNHSYRKTTVFLSAATLWSVMHIQVFDHFRNISQYTAKITNFICKSWWKKETRKQRGVLISPHAYINNIYSNGNAE